MWKEVVAVKRVFKEMSSATKIELGKIRCEIVGTTREVSGACSGVSVNMRNATKIDVSLKALYFCDVNLNKFFECRKFKISITNEKCPNTNLKFQH
jgi:hypothetical protein